EQGHQPVARKSFLCIYVVLCVQGEKASRLTRSLPVDLGAEDEQIGVDPNEIGPVEVRRILQHIDPVRHEADADDGIPVEAEREIRLPAALDVLADAEPSDAERLGEAHRAVVEIDLADSCRALPGSPPASAPRIEDLDLVDVGVTRRVKFLL